ARPKSPLLAMPSSPSTRRISSQGAPGGLAIREIPISDRPRERLRQVGAAQLSTAELIAILVGSGAVGHSAMAVGYEIMRRCHGSLRVLAGRPVAEVTAIRGIGL